MPNSSIPNAQHCRLIPRHLYSNQELLKDLKNVAARLGTRRLSQSDYSQFGQYSFTNICKRFHSWTLALERIGLEPGNYRNIPEALLLQDIRRVAALRSTRRLELNQYLAHGQYSRKVIYRLFGVWQHAALAAGLIPIKRFQPRLRGPRTINLALRFKILTRDHFRCQTCGRSPATHPDLHLEVDHITPWSQGGHTRPENLRTLCNQCNRGKSDSI